MIVLALNCGSSSVKWRLVDEPASAAGRTSARVLAEGRVEGLLDQEATLTFRTGRTGRTGRSGDRADARTARVRGHGDAVREVIAQLAGSGTGLPPVAAVGHRVVHGGTAFTRPAVIDADLLRAIETLDELAPLHNAPSLAGIRAARAMGGPSIPMVAVFDTAFHAALPDHAAVYAIPADLALQHGVRRFGFHGLSYESVVVRYCELTGTPRERATLVALHLGNGCSAAAIRGGQSVDTSMGFTPLEGLVMGTRAGDLDPAVVGYLARREGVGVERIEDWLNTRSGLLGLSGLSHDMRTLLGRVVDHAGARLALDVFCYRARKYLGAYLAALGGPHAVIFTGAIGENAPEIRARICAGMEWCGIVLDPARNTEAVGLEKRISRADAAPPVFAIPSDEEFVIARDTARCLEETGR